MLSMRGPGVNGGSEIRKCTLCPTINQPMKVVDRWELEKALNSMTNNENESTKPDSKILNEQLLLLYRNGFEAGVESCKKQRAKSIRHRDNWKVRYRTALTYAKSLQICGNCKCGKRSSAFGYAFVCTDESSTHYRDEIDPTGRGCLRWTTTSTTRLPELIQVDEKGKINNGINPKANG